MTKKNYTYVLQVEYTDGSQEETNFHQNAQRALWGFSSEVGKPGVTQVQIFRSNGNEEISIAIWNAPAMQDEQPVDLTPETEFHADAEELTHRFPEQYSPNPCIDDIAWMLATPEAREYCFFSKDVDGFFLVRHHGAEKTLKLMDWRLKHSFDPSDYSTRNHVSAFLAEYGV